MFTRGTLAPAVNSESSPRDSEEGKLQLLCIPANYLKVKPIPTLSQYPSASLVERH